MNLGMKAQTAVIWIVGLIAFGQIATAQEKQFRATGKQAGNVAATADGQIPRLVDGFEADSVEKFWLPGNYGSGLYVPGAIQVSDKFARSGKQSVEITVREGNVEAAGDAGTVVERSELDSGHFNLMGRKAWYGFSVLVPRDFPIVDTRLVISSCKQSDVSRPLTAQRFRNGKHTLTVESHGKKREFRLPDLPLGKWVDFVCHARYSPASDGAFEFWMNGKKVASYSGPLADSGSKNAFYHKIGLYRDRMKQPMTIYFDNYAMGDSYESVDRARFESNLKAPQNH
jgi:hypothetical protein